MTKEKVQLAVGGLLHDIGKVVYRQGDGRRHSLSGYEFLKEEAHLEDRNVLDSVRYHHAQELKGAKVAPDSFAYLTYFADNVAAAADRRKEEGGEAGFVRGIPLESVFNRLNGNEKKLYYTQDAGLWSQEINYPTEKVKLYDEHFYQKVKQQLLENFRGIRWETEYINSLLEILEGNLSLIPSSTARDEPADISLYDHMKLTAAVSACIYSYLQERGIQDYRSALFQNSREFYQEKAFLLLSMDVSGIQNFI